MTGKTDRLTDRAYWDVKYQPGAAPPGESSFKRRVKRLLGPRVVEWLRDYRDYQLWNAIYARYLPRTPGAKVLEVGSAPGTHLIELRQTFGYEPFGVEYTESGVQVNREEFQRHGINPANVIAADFFSSQFQNTYRGKFDVVVSRGFIEHFADVRAVIAAHVQLLTSDGVLVVTIPNLRGVNYVLQWLCDRAVLPLHNLDLMHRATFCEAFERQGLSALHCGYYGTFSFGVYGTSRPAFMRDQLLAASRRFQQILNVLFRAAFRTRGAETSFASPYLIYVGKKAT